MYILLGSAVLLMLFILGSAWFNRTFEQVGYHDEENYVREYKIRSKK